MSGSESSVATTPLTGDAGVACARAAANEKRTASAPETNRYLHKQVELLERRLLIAALQASPSRPDAARSLGISVRTLYYKLRKHQLHNA